MELPSENWQSCFTILPIFTQSCSSIRTNFISNVPENKEACTLHIMNSINDKRIQKNKHIPNRTKKTSYKPCNGDFRSNRNNFLENALSERCWHFVLPRLYISISTGNSIQSAIIFKRLFLTALVEADKQEVNDIANMIKLYVKYFPAREEKMKSFYETFILHNDMKSKEFRDVGNLIRRLTCNSAIEQEVKILSERFFLGRIGVCHDQENAGRRDEIPTQACYDYSVDIDKEKVLESDEILNRVFHFLELYVVVCESELGENRFLDLKLFQLALWGKGSQIALTEDCKALMKLFTHGPECYRNVLNRLLSSMAEVFKANALLMHKEHYLSSELINGFVSTLSVYINESGHSINLLRCISLSWLKFSIVLYIMLQEDWLKTKLSLSSSKSKIFQVLIKTFLDILKKQDQIKIKSVTNRTGKSVKSVYLLRKTSSRDKLKTKNMENHKQSGSSYKNYETPEKLELVTVGLFSFLRMCLVEKEKLYVPPRLLKILSTVGISDKNTNYCSFFIRNIIDLVKFVSLN